MESTLTQMNMEMCWMRRAMPNAPITPSNVGAIFLSKEE